MRAPIPRNRLDIFLSLGSRRDLYTSGLQGAQYKARRVFAHDETSRGTKKHAAALDTAAEKLQDGNVAFRSLHESLEERSSRFDLGRKNDDSIRASFDLCTDECNRCEHRGSPQQRASRAASYISGKSSTPISEDAPASRPDVPRERARCRLRCARRASVDARAQYRALRRSSAPA